MKPALLRTPAGRELLQRLSTERGVDPTIVDDLLDAIDEHAGMLRRRGLFQRFDAILDKARE
ncbi:hypothetical protein NKH33_24780 [Mesorhizobium sp. M1182]|uniref:Uncharacterized protein n=1 Tax=Mesorhizobium tamadayense TaxID=425306 RepID=A0A3P3FWW5_9HYPH|nr:hypothetical protein [Mesorhizobium tamadayense]RRI03118.1 hypothetical protein EH240_11155 [Mesorhizobium tamadayense]